MSAKAVLGAIIAMLVIGLAACSPADPGASAPASSAPASQAASSPSGGPPASAEEDAATPKPPAKSRAQAAESDQRLPTGELAETAFDADRPSLNGISLGLSAGEVMELHGEPADVYSLSSGGATIEMHEYEGFMVGYDDAKRVAYVEIASSDVKTGVRGLAVGLSSAEAAQAIGVEHADSSNVLYSEVSGGRVKVDVDPLTDQVLSIKLLAQ